MSTAEKQVSSILDQTGPKRMSLFERYLTLWVGLCVVVGVSAGRVLPPESG